MPKFTVSKNDGREPKKVGLTTKLSFGKYAGRKVKNLILEDRGYIFWLKMEAIIKLDKEADAMMKELVLAEARKNRPVIIYEGVNKCQN